MVGLIAVVTLIVARQLTPQAPLPVAGHVDTCTAASPIVAVRLAHWGLPAEIKEGGRVRFDGVLRGRSARFARGALATLVAAPGRVTARDGSGQVVLDDEDLDHAIFAVGGPPPSWTLEITPTADAHRRLATASLPDGVPALTWRRDGVLIGTSTPGLPAAGTPFAIPTDRDDAAVTMPLVNSEVLPCPADLVLAED